MADYKLKKQEDMKKLFAEFERIDEERNRNIEGTGLGMTITKNCFRTTTNLLPRKDCSHLPNPLACTWP